MTHETETKETAMSRLCSGFVTLTVLAVAGCATNPVTGESQLALISEQQEIAMGRQAADEVSRTLGLVDDAGLQRYVARIGNRLAAESERPDLPWQFRVVDDPTPNAFALPGGFIYLTRGMMNLLTSEAELAGVLGHEIAHVTARHAVSQISRQQLAQFGLGLGSIFFPAVQSLSPAIGAGLQLLFLKYSRDDERQADGLGFQYMAQEGYASSEFDDVFAALQRATRAEDGGIPGWLSTHPAPAERAEAAQGRTAPVGTPAGTIVRREAYLRQIDGLTYGENPRHGFFRDGTFYHPELRFQVTLPRSWQGRNLAQAVVGVAPQGDAAFELTLVPDAPDQAMAQLARQPGVEVGALSRQRIHGLSALSAQFLARTAQGPVRGVAAFVRHGGRTYQMIGYSSQAQFGYFGRTLGDIVETFGPVRDPRILTVQPQRIDIVQASRSETLQDLARRFDASVPPEQLAVLNHLPASSTRVERGSLVKLVI
jgi:predicted Zn-dependent protease